MNTIDRIPIHFITPVTPNSSKFRKKYGYIYGAFGLKSKIHALMKMNIAYITGNVTEING